MKGLWKNKLGGWSKDSKRKTQTKNKYYADNSVYNIKNNKYEDSHEYSYGAYYFKSDRVPDSVVFGKLDDHNKARQFERNYTDRRTRMNFRTYVARGNWDRDMKVPYGTKSVDYLVS